MAKILLVEDDSALQEAAALKLRKEGLDVSVAGTGEEALFMLSREKPDLVWLDILLPGMDGLEVLEKMRSSPALATIPVVIVSVSGGDAKKKRAEELKALDYIVKSEQPLDKIVRQVKNFTQRLENR